MSRAALAAELGSLRRDFLPDARLGVWEVEIVDRDGGLGVAGRTTVAGALEAIEAAAERAGARAMVEPLPEPGATGVRAVPHRSLAHLRREPAHAAELVTQLLVGEEAIVLRDQDGWLQVQAGGGYVGWAHVASVVRDEPGDRDAFVRRVVAGEPPAGGWIVVARAPVARAGPDPDAAIVADLVEGGRIEAEPADGALRVRLPDGLEGWLPAGAAVPAAELDRIHPADGPAIVAHATRYVGLPYLWGGASEKGFDCSGLVQRVYGLHGVRLPRDADQQAGIGDPVDVAPGWGAATDGDLAFFAEPPGDRVTHVGVLAVGGRMIHASTTRNGVAWDRLDGGDLSPFGRRLTDWLTGVRRVLP